MRFSLLVILVSSLFMGCQTSRKNLSTSTSAKKEAMIKNAKLQQVQNQSQDKILLGQKSLYEELTGEKIRVSPAQKALELARQSKNNKNYIQALKRYNTIIVRFPRTPQAKQAYLDKAVLYKEMGLNEQAQLNLKKAQNMRAQVTTSTQRSTVK